MQPEPPDLREPPDVPEPPEPMVPMPGPFRAGPLASAGFIAATALAAAALAAAAVLAATVARQATATAGQNAGLAACLALAGVLALRLRQARRAEHETRAMYAVVSQALEAVPIGVQIKAADGRYVWIGAKNVADTGTPRATMLGRTVEQLGLPADLVAGVLAHDRRVIASGEAGEPEEQAIRRPDGSLGYVTLVSKVPLKQAGRVTHLVTFAANLPAWRSAQVRAEEVRRLLETVLDAVPLTVTVVDRDNRIRWANRAFNELKGWTAGSPIGRTLQETTPPGPTLDQALAANRAILEGRESLVQIVAHYPASGERAARHLVMTKVPVRDAAGETAQVLTMAVDTTQQVRAQAEADTATRLMENILRHVPVTLQVKDAELRYLWANQAFAAAIGHGLDAILGRSVNELDVPERTQRETGERDRQVLATGETIRFEETSDASGSRRHMIAIKAPVFGPSGRITHLLTIGTDVTELHALRAEVEAARRRLQAVLDAVPVTIALKDTDRRYVWVNKEFERVHGRAADRVIGRRSEDWIATPELAERVGRIDAEMLAGGPQTPPMAQRFRHADGHMADFRVRRLIVRDAKGDIDGIIVVGMDVTDLMRTASELQSANALLEQRVAARTRELATVGEFVSTVIDRAPVPVVTLHPDGTVRSWNAAASKATGFSAQEMEGRPLEELFPDDRAAVAQRLRDLAAGRPVGPAELLTRRRDGQPIELLLSCAPLARDGATHRGAVSIWLDVTEQRAAERQLRQAQKMEAIGQLTGNVAHDFNNLLAVVIGNLDLLQEDLPDTIDPDLVADALDAAERGAALTARLLAFARQQTLRPVILCVGALIEGMRPLLQRAVGEAIAIDYRAGAGLWLARIDTNQLENAILNLCVNARDAMPDGGRLSITASNTTLDEAYARAHPDSAPGDYVCVSVADTGTGIAPEVIGQVFEPFFTTKGTGRGSGLGLSIVYGFAKQSGGHVQVASEPGKGTAFRLFLPRVAGTLAEPAPPAAIVRGGGETVLVVEDNAALRRTSATAVRALGYAVVEAADAEQALAALDARPDIALLLSDVVLPGGTNGFQLARLALQRRPALAVAFVSGYVDPALAQQQRDLAGTAVLTKPFRTPELAATLQAALARRPPAPAA
jgi:PAS domain S-box-containing protein